MPLRSTQKRQFDTLWRNPKAAFRALVFEHRCHVLDELAGMEFWGTHDPDSYCPFEGVFLRQDAEHAGIRKRLRSLGDEVEVLVDDIIRERLRPEWIREAAELCQSSDRRAAYRLAVHLATPGLNLPLQPVPLAIHMVRSNRLPG